MLEGTATPYDLTKMLLIMREYNHGREVVKEIGDAIAHPGGRDRGLSTRRVRDHAAAFRGILATRMIGIEGQVVSIDDFKAALKVQLRLHPDIPSELGLRPKVIEETLESALPKIRAIPDDGSILFDKNATARERQVVEVLGSVFSAPPVFTSNELFEGFIYTLKANKALTEGEVPTLSRWKRALTVFSLDALRKAPIKISPATTLQVKLFASDTVRIDVPHIHPAGYKLTFIFSLFDSSLPPEDVFVPSATASLAKIDPSKLELGDDFRLAPF